MVCRSVCRSVCVSVCNDCEPCKTAEPIDMSFVMWTRVGPRNHALHGVQISTCEGEILRAKRGRPRTRPNMSVDILKATQQGAEPVRCGCRLGCTGWEAHWRHLANTIEPHVCGGDAACCQITLTTCCYYCRDYNDSVAKTQQGYCTR